MNFPATNGCPLSRRLCGTAKVESGAEGSTRQFQIPEKTQVAVAALPVSVMPHCEGAPANSNQ